VKVVSAAADHLRPEVGGVVVLLYHRVGGRSSLEIDLDAASFDEQMAAVAARRVLPLGDALVQLATSSPRDVASNAASKPSASNASAVVVTFDDGTADFVEVALPIIVRHGVPVTLYLATDFVEGGTSAFPGGARALSWSALRDACTTGLVNVGSHTHSHRLLDRTPSAEAADELDRSIDLIGSNLGVTALDFAYPKAVPGRADVEPLVRDRFRSAALAGTRVNRFGNTDPYRLARSPIQVSDGMQFFGRKLAGGMALEDSVRRAMNRVRYARAGT
jgi:peptidoglycan/xylan/chitin deacetylase (PgdA/CDA1 family)